MVYFDHLLRELSEARVAYETLGGDFEGRARAKQRLHALRSQIALLRQVR